MVEFLLGVGGGGIMNAREGACYRTCRRCYAV